jgi:formamidopyrimidine-DNA glycosylase
VPELPEVETIRRGLNQVTLHQEITGGEVLLERTIASSLPEVFLQGLRGTAIAQWQRRGKYLLAQLVQDREGQAQGAGWWGIHLRMTGQLFWLKPTTPLQKHTRIRLFLDPDWELRFVDTRTFGQMWWVPPDQSVEHTIKAFQTLGPEPLSPDFSPAYLHQRLQRTQRPIKNALLDQTVIAGIGNIYADEALFLSGIHPTWGSDRLQPAQVEKLHGAIISVLEAGIAAGGTTLRDFRNLEGINGNYGNQAWVYRRTGEACRVCGGPISRIKLGGRSTHFCPTCQPL